MRPRNTPRPKPWNARARRDPIIVPSGRSRRCCADTLGFSILRHRCQVGQYVDIKVNPAQQKGMPYLAYQGRTGIVWNVTPRAVGVEVNKQVRVTAENRSRGFSLTATENKP
jgi:hypothetical protein